MVKSRTRDMVYMAFMLVHIPATCFVDMHALPFISNLLPEASRLVYQIAHKDDPLLQSAHTPAFAWFRSFLLLEILFQLPTFVYGSWALWRDNTTVYPLLTIYGASTATTTLACLATVLQMPLTRERQAILLAEYVPFCLLPLAMAVDYGLRLTKMVKSVNPRVAKGDKSM
ncbi:hypothetical protein OIO90_002078 [Microbotryomycetes sp. JL221]|nr:hypothetical protein OIO90_002078 [Microbotryomycetes sp. JL221]